MNKNQSYNNVTINLFIINVRGKIMRLVQPTNAHTNNFFFELSLILIQHWTTEKSIIKLIKN